MNEMARRSEFQVCAFKAVFKTQEGPVEDRFAQAVAYTSDDVVNRLLGRDPDMIDRYFASKRRRKDQDGTD